MHYNKSYINVNSSLKISYYIVLTFEGATVQLLFGVSQLSTSLLLNFGAINK